MEPVKYIEKTRQYYLAQGYDKPYEWAHHATAPFAPLQKPLSQSRLTLVSTSEIAIKFDPKTPKAPLENGKVRSVYSIPTHTPLELLYSRTHSYDDFATHMDDVNAYFPVTRLQEMVASGESGAFPHTFMAFTMPIAKEKQEKPMRQKCSSVAAKKAWMQQCLCRFDRFATRP